MSYLTRGPIEMGIGSKAFAVETGIGSKAIAVGHRRHCVGKQLGRSEVTA